MPVSNKHANAERIFYPAFDGGLNLSAPAESIAKNELREAVNVEFSSITGSLRVRGGLVWSGDFESPVYDAAEIPSASGFLCRMADSEKAKFFTWNYAYDVDGVLDGGGHAIGENGRGMRRMSVAQWGEAGECVVCCGGKLQRFKPVGESLMPELTYIEDSPEECRICFVRDGRVGVVDGNDTIRFSHVGDCERWDNDPDDESTGQFIEIGYKDGSDIRAVVPLAQDLVIFKAPDDVTKGTVFRLRGEFPDWVLIESAHNTGTYGQHSVSAVGNDVFFLNPHGLAMLSSVESYSEIKTMWPDRKISDVLRWELSEDSRLFNCGAKEQLWVKSAENSGLVWVFDYHRGIWTKFNFPRPVNFAASSEKNTYLFIDDGIYKLDEWYTHDSVKGVQSEPVKAKITLGTIFRGWQTLVKAVFASFHMLPMFMSDVLVNGKFRLPMRIPGEPEYAYDDDDIAYDDDDPLVPEGNTITARRRCLVRDWNIVPSAEIEGGGCAINTLGLEIAEV